MNTYIKKVFNFFKRSIREAKEIIIIFVYKIYFLHLYNRYKNFSMIPRTIFVDNLELCKKFSHINGCVIECGVWRGGMIAAMTEILGKNRNYYLFDSFEGLPEAKSIDGEKAKNWQNDTKSPYFFDNCKAEEKFAKKAMEISGVKKYFIHKGWFKDTLPNFIPESKIAILRLDGDWYESTMECLENLYKHVTEGGLMILDDYYSWDGCSKAMHDFLSKNKLADKIHQTKNNICYLIKTKNHE